MYTAQKLHMFKYCFIMQVFVNNLFPYFVKFLPNLLQSLDKSIFSSSTKYFTNKEEKWAKVHSWPYKYISVVLK